MLKVKGNRPLKGVIEVKGSKNASLALITASLLNKGKVTLENVPNIKDIQELICVLKKINKWTDRKPLIFQRLFLIQKNPPSEDEG